MFKVREKSTGEIVTVYDVKQINPTFTDDKMFLIYTDGKWVYVYANPFEPVLDDMDEVLKPTCYISNSEMQCEGASLGVQKLLGKVCSQCALYKCYNGKGN